MNTALKTEVLGPRPVDHNLPPNLRVIDLDPPEIDAQKSIAAWLSGTVASPPARLLYDATGAALFEQICQTPEYYLTRLEKRLLPHIPGALAPHLRSDAQIVEYGSGSHAKIALLLDALPQLRSHVPIDISKAHLIDNAQVLARRFSSHRFTAICADFFQEIALPTRADGDETLQNIGFFPGSTIGNMDNDAAIEFMANARRALGPGCLFILAIDRMKDPTILRSAYMDEAGVSARFSLNLIDRINREMSGDIDKSAFHYDAVFNPETEAIEMYWQVDRPLTAQVADKVLHFHKGQRFLVEISRKFTLQSLDDLAHHSGFDRIDLLSDSAELYSLALLRAQ